MSSSRAIIKSFLAIGSTTSQYANAKTVSGSMGADIKGPVMVLDKIDQVGFDVKWTSSNAVGVISVQATNDPQADPNAAGSSQSVVDSANWNDLTFNPVLTQPNSNDGAYMINLALCPFSFVRLKYTRTSGTGTLTVYQSAKGN